MKMKNNASLTVELQAIKLNSRDSRNENSECDEVNRCKELEKIMKEIKVMIKTKMKKWKNIKEDNAENR